MGYRMKREDLRVDVVYVGKTGRRRQIRGIKPSGSHKSYDTIIYDVPAGGAYSCTAETFQRWAKHIESGFHETS